MYAPLMSAELNAKPEPVPMDRSIIITVMSAAAQSALTLSFSASWLPWMTIRPLSLISPVLSLLILKMECDVKMFASSSRSLSFTSSYSYL